MTAPLAFVAGCTFWHFFGPWALAKMRTWLNS